MHAREEVPPTRRRVSASRPFDAPEEELEAQAVSRLFFLASREASFESRAPSRFGSLVAPVSTTTAHSALPPNIPNNQGRRHEAALVSKGVRSTEAAA